MANCREPVRTALVEDVLQHMRNDARGNRDRQKMITDCTCPLRTRRGRSWPSMSAMRQERSSFSDVACKFVGRSVWKCGLQKFEEGGYAGAK